MQSRNILNKRHLCLIMTNDFIILNLIFQKYSPNIILKNVRHNIHFGHCILYEIRQAFTL